MTSLLRPDAATGRVRGALWEEAKLRDGLTSYTNIDDTARQIDGNPNDAPYRVPKGPVREVFG